MATISKGITLKVGEKVLTNLQEIPELGGDAEAIEITTLADAAHMYTDGILNYGDSLAFKFLYEKEQFTELGALEGSQNVVVTLPDGATCTFSGSCSVKLDGVGVNAALTYTLSIKPDSAMIWA
ncbi:MAG: hypothetical protein J6Q96_01215 [Bacteroidales bacterium]|nr:hypothetical protein [Bacteroidales bacterium]